MAVATKRVVYIHEANGDINEVMSFQTEAEAQTFANEQNEKLKAGGYYPQTYYFANYNRDEADEEMKSIY